MSYFKDKKIVVTGGAGFLATHFITELHRLGADITTNTYKNPLQVSDDIKKDIKVIENLDLNKLENSLLLTKGAELVIHTAGHVLHPGSVRTDIQGSLGNITLLGNVLDACAKNEVESFFDLNSSTGYPDRRYPVKEEEFWDEEPFEAYFGYGWMRRYREKLMEHTSNFSNLNIFLGRGSAIFGPNDNFDVKTCHVIPAIINRMLGGENPFTAWGSPDVVRDFLYVKDVIKGALTIIEHGIPMEPYNVGYGAPITVRDIVNTIQEVSGLTPEIVWDNSKPTTIPFRMVSTEKINNLGFKPSYTFEEGIRETIKWYESNK
jgi:GDP-L-fucose synthase